MALNAGQDALRVQPQLAQRREMMPFVSWQGRVHVACTNPNDTATLGAIQHEFGTSWSITSAVYQTAIAWLVALLVYQIGSLLGLA